MPLSVPSKPITKQKLEPLVFYTEKKTTVNTRHFYAVQTLTQIILTTDDTIYIVLGIKNSNNNLVFIFRANYNGTEK